MARINIPKKYLDEFVDVDLIKKHLPTNGTMPADLKAIKAAIGAKLADRKFLEGFVNDCIQGGDVRVVMKK